MKEELTIEELEFLKKQAEEDCRAYSYTKNAFRPQTPEEIMTELKHKTIMWNAILSKILPVT